MSFEQLKTASVGGWILTWGAVALAVGAASVSGWALLFGAGALPSLALLRLWREQTRTGPEPVARRPVAGLPPAHPAIR